MADETVTKVSQTGAQAINPREKILALVVGSVAVIFVLVFGVDKLFIAPAHHLDQLIASERQKVNALAKQTARKGRYERRLRDVARLEYADSPRAASEAMRAKLVELLGEAGLNEQQIQLTPEIGRRVPNVMESLGWAVSIRGRLDHVVNFLYLLEHQPRVHRLEDLILMPVPRSDQIALRVKCMTAVLDAPPGMALPSPRTAKELDPVALDDSMRPLFQPAVARDVFLPAIMAPQPAQVAVEQASAPQTQPATVYTVVGLPRWGGRSDVIVRVSAGGSDGQTAIYHRGDTLAGVNGQVIVAVDYRPLPRPDDPQMISESRVILLDKANGKYFAVEIGDTLAQKHPIVWPPFSREAKRSAVAINVPSTQPTEH